jgi:RNA polymerase sigma-70 factor (ECF subfamily)
LSASDDEIAARIQKGDATAFDEFFDRFAGRLLGYIGGLVGDAGTAEDLLQETMLRVYRNIGRYEARGVFGAWVFRIASKLAFTELRRRRFRAAPLAEPVLDVPDPIHTDPAEIRVVRERERAIEAALASLPDDQRAVVLLRVRDGMSLEEIARTMCVPVGTVKSRLHHAIRRLRMLLVPDGTTTRKEETHEEMR